VISRILIVIGLLIAVVSNLATFYGIRTAISGMMNAESAGIASVARGMNYASYGSVVGLLGCFVLTVGLLLAAVSSPAKSAVVR
jgi:ABC-type transport system involved in multi-copper enzyme maturation permease subunit